MHAHLNFSFTLALRHFKARHPRQSLFAAPHQRRHICIGADNQLHL